MVDSHIVIERLEALDTYLAELDYYARFSLKELTVDFVKYRAAQRSLQLATQVVVDIATHIVTADFNAQVQEYRQAIEYLGKFGVLPLEFAQRLSPLAGFRNILVHEYLVVDPLKLYDNLINGRADLREFGRYVSKYLQQTGGVS